MKDQKNKKHRTKLHEISLDQDIRYRGPLSYRHFRILGWICIAISQVVLLMSLVSMVNPDIVSEIGMAQTALSFIASLSAPFLLLANFALILDYQDGFKKQIMINAVAAGAIILLYLLVYYRYYLGIRQMFSGNNGETVPVTADSGGGNPRVFAFNFFIDLLLCTLVMLFLTYRPKRVFTGKKIRWFRLLAILPVAYEIVSLIILFLVFAGRLQLSPAAYPFLTTKPPMMFFVFLIMAVYIKNRERRFCKYGRSHEEYKQFLKTNRNSFQFSRFTAILLAVAGAVDFVMLVLMSYFVSDKNIESVEASVYLFYNIGIGKSAVLIPLAPIVLLFSYTRTHKNKFIDYLIPVFGVFLIIFVYLEGIRFGVSMLPAMLGAGVS